MTSGSRSSRSPRLLRDHPDISKATRERILLKVKELGYRPNLTARSLVTGRSSLIGLIVPDLIHPFFADIAKGLSLAMRRQGYFLVLSSSEEDPDLEREEIEQMLAHRLDALIVASCQSSPESLRVDPAGRHAAGPARPLLQGTALPLCRLRRLRGRKTRDRTPPCCRLPAHRPYSRPREQRRPSPPQGLTSIL